MALTGFDQDELERLLVIEPGGDGDPDDAPEPPAEPISKPGDLWICGEHQVLCGDATSLADIEKVLGGELADMTFTDPPYNVNYANSAEDRRGRKNRPIMNGSALIAATARSRAATARSISCWSTRAGPSGT